MNFAYIQQEKLIYTNLAIKSNYVNDLGGRFVSGQIAERDVSLLRRHESTGRPLGGESFIDGLERALNRKLRKQKPGPKPNRRTR